MKIIFEMIEIACVLLSGVLVLYCIYILEGSIKDSSCKFQIISQVNMTQPHTKDNFWSKGLGEIEASLFPEGITLSNLNLKHFCR